MKIPNFKRIELNTSSARRNAFDRTEIHHLHHLNVSYSVHFKALFDRTEPTRI